MARELGESPATVHGWKQKGRIPAEKQPHVLKVGLALGLPISAEHVVFPLGRPNADAPSDVATGAGRVDCGGKPRSQQTGAPQ